MKNVSFISQGKNHMDFLANPITRKSRETETQVPEEENARELSKHLPQSRLPGTGEGPAQCPRRRLRRSLSV